MTNEKIAAIREKVLASASEAYENDTYRYFIRNGKLCRAFVDDLEDVEVIEKSNADKIAETSKQGQRVARAAASRAFSRGLWNYPRDIYEAYTKPSIYKVRAWEYCRNMCRDMGGHDLIISAAGCQTFSVCFKFEADGKPAYAYITRDYNRFCFAE